MAVLINLFDYIVVRCVMKINYDLHIHSGLSPCADNDMSPINILAMASVKGLNMIAIADHNSIKNVENAIEIGKLLTITVVPAMELQTAEDVHFVCLFADFASLSAFYAEIGFQQIPNREDVFGEQIIYDEDGEPCGYEPNLLLVASSIPSYKIKSLADKYNGIAIPAHIDREANSMLYVLGSVDEEFKVVELSDKATAEQITEYKNRGQVIFDSDAHTLTDIGKSHGVMELKKNTAQHLIQKLKEEYGQ